MTTYCGSDFLIQMQDEPTAGEWETIAELQGSSASINNTQVDTSSKDTNLWRRLSACGIKSMTLNGDGIANDDNTYIQLKANAHGNTIAVYRLINGYGDTWQGSFQISSLEMTGNNGEAETFSLTLESAGEITFTAGP